MFVLYKLTLCQCAYEESDGAVSLLAFCPKLLHLSLEALLKTQDDTVRLNCVGLYCFFYPFVISVMVSFKCLI